MNIQPVTPTQPTCFLKCCNCGATESSDVMLADLDGEPYFDYYCPQCAKEITGDDNLTA